MYMGKGLFVTATDTEVGKTFVSYLIARGALDAGIDGAVIKPVATGGRMIGGELVSPDALFLKKNLSLQTPYRELNPVCLKSPLAPYPAARIEKQPIKITQVIRAVREAQERHDFLVVEGIGGVAVPITKNYLVRDLIRDVGFPAVVVARPALGTINHTLLTVYELVRNGIAVAGIVINHVHRTKRGLAEKTSPAVIEEISGAPVLCEIPFISPRDEKKVRKAGRQLFAVLRKYAG